MPILSGLFHKAKSVRAMLTCLVVLAFSIASRHFIVDDGLIYARFIRNALQGNGLVFNAGESVNALTSPLFSYLLLGVSWMLRGHIVVAEHLLFSLSFLAVCLAAETVVCWAGVVLASTAYFYLLIGLESSLFLFLILLIAKFYATRSYDWLPILLVLCILTRFEGGLLVPIVGVQLWRDRRAPRWNAFLPAILLCVAYLALNYHWYGAILPNSAASKFGQARSGYWGEWPTAFLRVGAWTLRASTGVFRPTFYVLPIVAWFGFLGWRRMRVASNVMVRINAILAPLWIGLLLFYTLLNIPSYHWYYAPLILIAIVYAAYEISMYSRGQTIFAVVLAVSCCTNLAFLSRLGPNLNYVNVALWLDAHAPKNASVEAVELGQVGWSAHRRLIDILGLTFPKNADHIAHRDPASWLGEDKPDFIVVHRPLWVYEKVTAEHPEYRELPFHSGNIYLLQRVNDPTANGHFR